MASATLLLCSAVASGLSCSQTTRYQVLSTLFDGVPPPGGWPEKEATDRVETRNDAMDALAASRVTIYFHEPYKNRQCRECHVQFGGRLIRSPEEGLCMGCHDNLTSGLRYVHGPVAAGACRLCHLPHQSTIKYLLVEESAKLCEQCHPKANLDPAAHPWNVAPGESLLTYTEQEAPPLVMGPTEQADADKTCVDCHDPHGSDERYFLKGGSARRGP